MIEIAAAYAVAQAAVAGVKAAIELGKEAQDCYHEIASFFQAQGEIQATIIEQEHEKKMGRTNPISQGEATKQALDATFAARKMFRMEQELKEILIYQSGNESGLYEEMCMRRDAIILEVKNRIEEEARQVRMAAAAAKRRREERIQNFQEWCAVVVGVSISSAIIWAVWWLFKHGDE